MSRKKIKVLPPTWRPDIKEDIDLIEELIRIKGYDKVPLINPEKENIKDTLNCKQKLFHFAQRSVASKGYTEADYLVVYRFKNGYFVFRIKK